MRFIIWTAVWFGLLTLEEFSPQYEKPSEDIRLIVAVVMLTLWIGLYLVFIRDEK